MGFSESSMRALSRVQKGPPVRDWILAGNVPKDPKAIREQYLAEHLPYVSRALAEAFTDGTLNQKLKACEIVLGYLWGKPQVEVNMTQNSQIVMEMIEEAKSGFVKALAKNITGVEE